MAEKILIVDDDIDSLKLIGLMLQRHGYEVIAANAGKQVVNKAIGEQPDLIILDVMMPDMDGYEVTRRLRSNQSTQDIPIIMFTAKTLIDDKVKAFELGAEDYLTKPTHPAELASRVKSILARSTGEASDETDAGDGATVIGVIGAKGGVGTTTVAANLGAALNSEEQKTVVADFCLGSGALGLMLGHKDVSNMPNLLRKQANKINPNAVTSRLTDYTKGMQLLLTASQPKDALISYAPETAVEVVKTLRRISDHVLLDLGSQMTPAVNMMVREVDQLLVVLQPNPIAVSLTKGLLSALEENEVRRKKISLVVISQSQSGLHMPWQDIEQSLGLDLKAIISAAPDLAYQAAEAKTPIVLFRPGSITADQLNKLAESLISA